MPRRSLEELEEAASRAASRLYTLAGVSSGLLTGLGFFFVRRDDLASALALWALAGVVGVVISVAASHLGQSAAATVRLGDEVDRAVVTAHRRDAEHAQLLGELRTRVMVLERELEDVRAELHDHERHPTPAPIVAAADPLDTGSLTGTVLLSQVDDPA